MPFLALVLQYRRPSTVFCTNLMCMRPLIWPLLIARHHRCLRRLRVELPSAGRVDIGGGVRKQFWFL